MTNKELKKKVLEHIQTNHIWINAMNCINPTIEFKIKLADTILELLKKQDNLLPDFWGHDDDNQIPKIAKLTPVLYLSINKS